MSDKLQEPLNKFVQAHLAKNPRSGWKHKAWGGAKRNPRLTTDQKTERAKRATALTPQFCLDKRLSPTSRALPGVPTILGFRFAPPQALCFHPLRGLNKKNLYQLIQSLF